MSRVLGLPVMRRREAVAVLLGSLLKGKQSDLGSRRLAGLTVAPSVIIMVAIWPRETADQD